MSQINDIVKMKGDVRITVVNQSGTVTQEYEYPNLVVNTGKNHMAARLANMTTDGSAITHMAIGTDKTSPTIVDTSLISQLGARSSVTLAHTVNTSYMTATASFTGGSYASTNICEAGLFTASTAGLLICRTTFAPFTILSTDMVGITWKITII